jgi:hypothetical protein
LPTEPKDKEAVNVRLEREQLRPVLLAADALSSRKQVAGLRVEADGSTAGTDGYAMMRVKPITPPEALVPAITLPERLARMLWKSMRPHERIEVEAKVENDEVVIQVMEGDRSTMGLAVKGPTFGSGLVSARPRCLPAYVGTGYAPLPPLSRRRWKWRSPVTLCVGVLAKDGYDRPVVFCVSDRMLTSKDVSIKVEPPHSKQVRLSKTIVAMFAGTAGFQAYLLAKVRAAMGDDADSWTVEAVVRAYEQEFLSDRRHAAEVAILAPYGLDFETYIERLGTMPLELARRIEEQLGSYFQFDDECLIVGLDKGGGHIFLIAQDQHGRLTTTCEDHIGFAAIGTGSLHAYSYLLTRQNVPMAGEFPVALVHAYIAKKRGEIAPDVGKGTDFFEVAHDGYKSIPSEIVATLEKAHEEEMEALEYIYQTPIGALARRIYKAFMVSKLVKPSEKKKLRETYRRVSQRSRKRPKGDS